MSQQLKIAHLTSVHADNDIRIFYKECTSLAEHGYDVTEITLNGNPRTENGVKIISALFKPKSRLDRILKSAKLMYKMAVDVDADIYHFHDPELLRVGLKLKRLGKIVIYDAHEDTPRQLLTKPYLNQFLRKIISFFYERHENYIAKRLDAVVTVTPHLVNRYKLINTNTVQISNYPLIDEIETEDLSQIQALKENSVCYIGGVSEERGILQMMQGAQISNTRLAVAGKWNPGLKEKMSTQNEWDNVNDVGFLNREELKSLKNKSIAGLVTLLPRTNYISSFPIKMFEYMSAGIPVIASNFPLWESIIKEIDCGICIDPTDPQAISDAIIFLKENKDKALEMGKKGRTAIKDKLNWNVEKEKLFQLYESLSKNQ